MAHLPRYARRTTSATELLTALAVQAPGEGGVRLAHKAGVSNSPDMLLRLLHDLSDEAAQRDRGSWASMTSPFVASSDGMAPCCSISNRIDQFDLLDDRTAEVFANCVCVAILASRFTPAGHTQLLGYGWCMSARDWRCPKASRGRRIASPRR